MPTTNTTTTKANDWKDKELGCLWRREKQTTKERYLTGVINLKRLGFDKDVQIIVFSNKGKTKDAHPDLRVYLSEKKPAAAPAAKPSVAPEAPVAPDASELI